MADRTEPTNVAISLALIFSSMLLFGFLMVMIFYFQQVQNEFMREKIDTTPSEQLRVLRAHEEEFLIKYEYLNKEEGTVRIPIEHAMQLEAIKPWRKSPAKQ